MDSRAPVPLSTNNSEAGEGFKEVQTVPRRYIFFKNLGAESPMHIPMTQPGNKKPYVYLSENENQ